LPSTVYIVVALQACVHGSCIGLVPLKMAHLQMTVRVQKSSPCGRSITRPQ